MSIVCKPEGPSTQHLRFLVPKTIPVMVSRAKNSSNAGYLDPLGNYVQPEMCLDKSLP